jgi:mRNA deadenylase 3'-5' endonuclease subunit Ccr4
VANERRQFVVAGTHLYWEPSAHAIRLQQIKMLLSELNKSMQGREDLPAIICGDLNSTNDSPVFEALSKHSPKLLSVYNVVPKEHQPKYTIFLQNQVKVVDYIWFTPASLIPLKILKVPSDLDEKIVHLPTQTHPSDHFFLYCEFGMKDLD